MAANGFVQFPAISILCLKRVAVEYIYVSQVISVDSAVTAPPQAPLGLSVQSPTAKRRQCQRRGEWPKAIRPGE